MLPGDAIEPVLHILAGDGVQGPLQPVGEIDPQVLAVEPYGVGRTVGICRHIDLEGVGEQRQAARLGPFPGGVFAPGDTPEQVPGQPPGQVGGDAPVASDDDALVGRLAPAVAGAVVDDEGLGCPSHLSHLP